MHLFFLPDLEPGSISIPEDEARHMFKALRLTQGDKVMLTDGKGLLAEAEILELGQKRGELNITTRTRSSRPSPMIHLAISPTKNSERLEWLVEKAVEIGVSEISLIICEHSERKIQKTDRLIKIAVSAMKQSGQTWLPSINEASRLKDFISSTDGQKFVAHCREGHRRALSHSYIPGEDAVILIGPEGDFSNSEIELTLQHGFQPVTLGNNRLRTETAALVAVHTMLVANQ